MTLLYPAASIQYRRSLISTLEGYAVAAFDSRLGITLGSVGVQLERDIVAARNISQGTSSAEPLTPGGLQSYYTGDGTSKMLVSAAGVDLTGGDLCLITICKLNALTVNRTLLCLGSGSTARTRIRTNTAGTNFSAVVVDSVGSDTIVGPASDLNVHCQILRNEVGVSRRFYVDGGAGTAGLRTTAIFDVHTMISVLGTTALGGLCNGRSYFNVVCKPAPPVSVLNVFGPAAAARFGFTWTTLT